MTRLFKPYFVAICLACSLSIGAAAEKSSPVALLREALHAESLGAPQLRAEAVGDETPLAQAYAGKIKQGEDWLLLDEAIARRAKDAKLEEYRSRQAALRDNAAEHLALADWCLSQGLVEQERAHVLRALDFDPDNQSLRMRVGHVRGERRWQSPDELAEQQRLERALAEASSQWQPMLKQLKYKITYGNQEEAYAATAQVRQVRDPLAVPSLVEVFGVPKHASLLAQTLVGIDDPSAVEALVQLAVEGETADMRSAAVSELKHLDRYAFVPLLLSGLRQEISGGSWLGFDAQRKPVYSQRLQRAAEDHDEILDISVDISRIARGNSSSRQALQLRAKVEDERLAKAIKAENEKAQQRNLRIIEVLQSVTETTPTQTTQSPRRKSGKSPYDITTTFPQGASPQPWWDWWKRENDVVEQRTRGVVRFHRTSAVAISNDLPYGDAEVIPSSFQSSSEFQSPRMQQRCECFIAGTPVWTARGKLAIEQIRTGELVLTQNVQSGQLEFKPVVRPTTRPTMALVNLTIGRDEFTCTGGHLFWAVGQGWVKASNLKAGMVVHGAQQSATVVSNEFGPTSPTFNLVMADNHNYFVGESRLLTHDNTPRQATSLIAPGVSAEEE
jgi:hypothetical protein